MRQAAALLLLLAALAAGWAWAQDGADEADYDRLSLLERLENVRREVKVIDLDTALRRVPAVVASCRQHRELLDRMNAEQKAGGDITPIVEQARDLKVALLTELNDILKLHQSPYLGISKQEVMERLANTRFRDVIYRKEWLVNILDDIEEQARVNLEVDARIYKFDTVTFDFEKTSARAMLQILGDGLLFKWLVRGDTVYVYKERHEILFGGEWLVQKKAAWRARKKALEEAAKEAEKRALEEAGGSSGGGGR